MADGRSSASVVIVDPVKAAQERDAAARALLAGTPREQPSLTALTGVELTVPYNLKLVTNAHDKDQAKQDAECILREAFQFADGVLNKFNPESEVSVVNRLQVGQSHTMSPALCKVMSCCLSVYNSSGGSFDPSVAPLSELLQESVRKGVPVDQALHNKLAQRCNLSHSFDITPKTGVIVRKHEDAALDLGGVAKGYIVDVVIDRLRDKGYSNVFFDWGGDCRACGTNAQGQLWTVGITRPPAMQELGAKSDTLSFLQVCTLNDQALATSGDYENLVQGSDGSLHTTIYNWKTKSLIVPNFAQLAQVTVKCYSAMYADALATASLVKRDPVTVRYMLDNWRYKRERVTDYLTYTRENERVARMFETVQESDEIRQKRIMGSLPARVIVIGGGLAGQSAAIEAASCGAHVILLEKNGTLGGNSAKATSGINGWGSRAQAEQDVLDSGKFFERDTFKSGLGGTCDAGLVKTLSVRSADAIKWLSNLGVPLTVLSQLGGHSKKRTHRAPDMTDGTPVPIGYTIMQTLEKHIRAHMAAQITVMTNTTVTSLIHKKVQRFDGVEQVSVHGVEMRNAEGENMKLMADAVILATGGFSHDQTNSSLIREFAPSLFGYPTTNGEWATGDGVKLARSVGAKLVDMDKVQLHPTGFIDPKNPSSGTKYLGPEALRGSGGILLNKNGNRFVNELDLRSVVSNAIIAEGNEYPGSNGSKFAFCVLNEAAAKLFGAGSFGFYWKRMGLFQKADSVDDLAKLIGCDAAHLARTLSEYEKTSMSSVACPITGKTVFPCVIGATGPYYVSYVTPSIHYTMGGCLISPSGEIQTDDDLEAAGGRLRPILGLFGAGEVTGGVHGANRLGGNSLLECVVFGKVAGRRAGFGAAEADQ